MPNEYGDLTREQCRLWDWREIATLDVGDPWPQYNVEEFRNNVAGLEDQLIDSGEVLVGKETEEL